MTGARAAAAFWAALLIARRDSVVGFSTVFSAFAFGAFSLVFTAALFAAFLTDFLSAFFAAFLAFLMPRFLVTADLAVRAAFLAIYFFADFLATMKPSRNS